MTTPRRLAATAVALAARVLGLLRLLRWLRRRRGDFRVFILEYHDVDGAGHEQEGTISQTRFRRHLRWLARHYRFDTVAGAAARLAAGELVDDVVVITFDDGYAGNAEAAFPVLRELGLPATVFLTTGFLDGHELWFDVARRALDRARGAPGADGLDTELAARLADRFGTWPPVEATDTLVRRLKDAPASERLAAVGDLRAWSRLPGVVLAPPARPMTWDQARDLRDGGVELGAHTVHHPILSRLDADGQEREIADGRRRLVEELGEAPASFAMPNGSVHDYDSTTLDLLRKHGFAAACTTRRGSNRAGCDLYQLRRLGVGADALPLLEARLAGLFDEGVRRFLPFTRG